MGKNGLGRKLVFVAAAVGAILLVLRIVGGRGGGTDGDAVGDAIDRVDTGRSADEDADEGPVATGLERVSTDDSDDGSGAVDDEQTAATGATADDEAVVGEDGDETEDGDEAGGGIPVETTGGRFDDLDLFDYVAILGAAAEAAREEYRNRV